MNRKSMQDITPGKRSIRDIEAPNRRGRPGTNTPTAIPINKPVPPPPVPMPEPISATQPSRPSVPEPRPIPPPPPFHPPRPSYNFEYDTDEPKKKSHGMFITLVVVFVLAAAFGVMSLFSSATVKVTAKSQVVPANITLTATKDQPAGVFGYQIVSVSTSAQQSVTAGTASNVQTKAFGTIIVYNASANNQNLVVNTRFQTSTGLVFRLTKGISVPKGTAANPGSVSASVIADQPGPEYNIDPTDFTLPGLAGSPQAKQVYGRSAAAMSGGFSGIMKKVTDADMAAAKTTLENTLKSNLQNQISTQIPSNFILYPSSVSYNFGAPAQAATTTADNSAIVTESGTAVAVIFDRTLLSQAILNSLQSQLSMAATTTNNQAIATVLNVSDLTFALTNPPVLTAGYTNPITFTLSGDAHVQWLFDQTALRSDLAGLKKSNLNALLSAKYPTIDFATASIFPVWKQSFPSDPAKISITQANSQAGK